MVFPSLAEMKKVVFVLGGPGSGKGTQCEKIVQNFGYVHLSAGDLLREERANPNSKHGELIEDYIRNGKIVPVEITCSLLKDAMEKSNSQHFLIDGFPRSEENLNGWNKEMSNEVHLQFVLYFDCPQEVCLERCLKRGSAGSGRSDDNVDSLKKRFNTYVNDTMPIIEHYNGLNLLRKVCANKDADAVFADVKSIFEKEN
ncbi:UMP-CMP kinase isoform X2 [Hetaerina americana]|uniref:UMP-CMP kinase isoform X2 n=1 Tax=Hetaerina americana TaxID=62018 RepID=UPI003A7F521A